MFEISTATENLTQFQAWQLWSQNADIANSTLLWGLSVRNWGRIGKCMQALAAFAVLLDIIGAPAVRRFGDWLKNLTTINTAKNMLRKGWQKFADIFVLRESEVMSAERFFEKYVLPAVFITAGLIAIFIIYPMLTNGARPTFGMVIVLLIIGGGVFFICFFTLLVAAAIIRFIIPFLIFVFALYTIAIDFLLIEPTAWIIAHQKNEYLIKGLAFAVFFIGFYFDLLAS